MATVHFGRIVFSFLNGSLSLVFRHFDAGSEGEVPGCNLATCFGNRNGVITTPMMSGLEHPGRLDYALSDQFFFFIIFLHFYAIFLSSEPPVDPKTVQNLGRVIRKHFFDFSTLSEGSGPKILTLVLVKPGLIVKRFGS